jgi:hypothetical protein
MNKDCQMMLSQNDIGAAGQLLVMQAITKAFRMQELSHKQFRSSILASDTSHHARTRFFIDYVGHTW